MDHQPDDGSNGRQRQQECGEAEGQQQQCVCGKECGRAFDVWIGHQLQVIITRALPVQTARHQSCRWTVRLRLSLRASPLAGLCRP